MIRRYKTLREQKIENVCDEILTEKIQSRQIPLFTRRLTKMLLKDATPDDMSAELGRRGLTFALMSEIEVGSSEATVSTQGNFEKLFCGINALSESASKGVAEALMKLAPQKEAVKTGASWDAEVLKDD